MTDWLDHLPRQLAAVELRKVRDYVLQRYRDGKCIAVALGGHVIKTGCAPYLIDLIRRGIIHAIAMNGSAAIHDFELAFAGKTSEDVAAQLHRGDFGMARETAEIFAQAVQYATKHQCGLGYALGWLIRHNWLCPHADISLVAAAHRYNIPCTIHVAIGTDIVHMHPQIDGAALGIAAMFDFRLLCSVVTRLREGLWFNLGSAVIMPEVFLKAVSVARNCGHDLDGLVTVNFDKEAKYRTAMNVLRRPGAEGIEIIGHHELLIPLWHAAIIAGLQQHGLCVDEENQCNGIKDSKYQKGSFV
jgi:deoxyhypusine synthase